MEPFTLLDHWRGAAALASPDGGDTPETAAVFAGENLGSDEDAPFFDLEFSAPPEEDENASTCAVNGDEIGGGAEPHGEAELNNGSEPNNPKTPQFHVSLVKSANKIRVLISGFTKSKQSTAEKTEQHHNPPPDTAEESRDDNFFTARLNAEEVPIRSLFAGDNSAAASKAAKPQKQSIAMRKYLKNVKLRFSGQLSLISGEKQGNMSAGLRVVRKHFRKSRSAAAVSAAPPLPAVANRRDDSLAQQHDGIQSAILHCKSSFNAPPDSESSEKLSGGDDVACNKCN